MKKVFFAAIAAAVLLTACNSGGSSDDPKQVLMAFFDALQKKDMKTAKELATPESAQMLGFMEMGMNDPKAADAKDEFDKSKMEFGEAKIDGDNAKVPVTNKEKKETTNFPMKKVNGKWKVAFDKNSMMEMANEKAKEEGINLQDTVNAAMKEMKNMDIDSLSREINQAMDTTGKQ